MPKITKLALIFVLLFISCTDENVPDENISPISNIDNSRKSVKKARKPYVMPVQPITENLKTIENDLDSLNAEEKSKRFKDLFLVPPSMWKDSDWENLDEIMFSTEGKELIEILRPLDNLRYSSAMTPAEANILSDELLLYARELNDQDAIGSLYWQAAMYSQRGNEYIKSAEIFDESIEQCMENNVKFHLGGDYKDVCMAYVEAGRPDLSDQYLQLRIESNEYTPDQVAEMYYWNAMAYLPGKAEKNKRGNSARAWEIVFDTFFNEELPKDVYVDMVKEGKMMYDFKPGNERSENLLKAWAEKKGYDYDSLSQTLSEALKQ